MTEEQNWSQLMTILPGNFSLSHQLPITQPLAKHPPHHRLHLLNRVSVPVVMPTCKIGDIPVQMFSTHLVVDAAIPELEQSPKAFHPVRVNLALHVLAN